MNGLLETTQHIADLLWGWPFMILLSGTGLFLTVRLRGIQFRKLGQALYMARPGAPVAVGAEGDISNFKALMTALSATVGTGNIAGVATAIAIGGPGAMFWMWMMGLIGMATKYSEAILAVHFREKNAQGEMCGGPMYYISRGLGSNPFSKILAAMFAIFTIVAALIGIGCLIQSNTIADALEATFELDRRITAVALMVVTGAVLLGGIKSIGRVVAVFVPTMVVAYLGAGLVVLVLNASEVPAAFSLIFREAFQPTAATGGFVGSAVMLAVQMGVSRGLFSNESGLGSAPIAAAAATVSHPAQQALISMTQTFIDTMVICTITALVLIVTGAWNSGETGARLTTMAFQSGFSGGNVVVAIALLLFAWSTMLGWSYYGEKALEYLFGSGPTTAFRIVFVFLIGIGAIAEADLVWTIGDISNALMAFPNLIALLLLSPLIVKLTNEYFADK